MPSTTKRQTSIVAKTGRLTQTSASFIGCETSRPCCKLPRLDVATRSPSLRPSTISTALSRRATRADNPFGDLAVLNDENFLEAGKTEERLCGNDQRLIPAIRMDRHASEETGLQEALGIINESFQIQRSRLLIHGQEKFLRFCLRTFCREMHRPGTDRPADPNHGTRFPALRP